VVLLTNCQGYGGEYADTRRIYPAYLQQELNTRAVGASTNWTVLNWSVDGATSIEMMIMAAYLKKQPPAVILAPMAYADYRSEVFDASLSFCRTDLPRLLNQGHIRRQLPPAFMARHSRVEDRLSFWIRDHVALTRFKEYLWCRLERLFPGIHTIFYAPKFSYMPWHLPRPKRFLVPPLQLPTMSDDLANVRYDTQSRILLDEYLDMLAGIGTRVIVVAEPIQSSDNNHRAFLADLADATRARQLIHWDLNDALPADRFLGPNHLHTDNHRRFAEILGQRMAELPDPR
jgi:hypothetical protein